MTSLEIALELDEMLSEAQTSFKRAKVMAYDLGHTYFYYSSKEKLFSKDNYEEAQTKHEIALDCLLDLEKELQKMIDFTDRLYEQEKMTAAEQGKEVAKCQT